MEQRTVRSMMLVGWQVSEEREMNATICCAAGNGLPKALLRAPALRARDCRHVYAYPSQRDETYVRLSVVACQSMCPCDLK